MIFRKRLLYQTMVLIIGLLAYYFVFDKLLGFSNWLDFLSQIQGRPAAFAFIIGIQLILLSLNFIAETWKWHYLISTIHVQPWKKSLKQVLAGYSVGTFTPGRLGEPIGRLIDLPSSARLGAIGLTFVGGIVQNITIIFFGVMAILCQYLFLDHFNHFIEKHGVSALAIGITLLAMMVLALGFIKFILPFKYKQWRRELKIHWNRIAGSSWIWIVAFTIFRYLIFSLQLYIWLVFFITWDHAGALVLLIPIYYLVITILPSFVLTELGVKGSTAIVIFGASTTNHIAIIMVVFLFWIMNVGLPTLIGASIHIKHNNSYKKTI